MAPLAVAGAAVLGASYIIPQLPCWLWIVAPLVAFVAWLLLFDADSTTYLSLAAAGIDSAVIRGKVVWIVGASSGIGEALAIELAKHGAKVVLSARRKAELDRVAALCVGPFPAFVLPLDVLDYDAHPKALAALLAKHGSLDIAVLNAGRTQRALAETTEVEVTRQMLDLNVISQISIAKQCLTHFLAKPEPLAGAGSGQQRGLFVVTSSVSGKFGAPVASSYCATKHALHGYFDALRLEVADRGVGVCMVCPGPVSTPIEAESFVSQAGQRKGTEQEDRSKKMSAARCAQLMATAMSRDIDETWISRNPVLCFTYLAVYAPTLWRFLCKRWLGPMRTKAFREGRDVFDVKGAIAGAVQGATKNK